MKVNKKTMGILYIILAALGFSFMTFFIRLSGDLPTMQKAFFRNAIAAGIAIYLLSKTEEKFRIKKTSWRDLILRAAFGTSGLIANFWAIDHLRIADANILNKMSPFFAIIMSVFILREIPSKFEWGTIVLAFIGAIFVVKPSSGVASIPAIVGLLSGFGAGTAYTFVRKLGLKGERGPVIVMFFSAFSSLVTLPFFIINFKPMTAGQVICLIMTGLSAAVGQLSITKAYTWAPAKEISVFDYTQVVFAALLGIIFLGQIPDSYSLIGYIIIIGTAVLKWYYNLKKEA